MWDVRALATDLDGEALRVEVTRVFAGVLHTRSREVVPDGVWTVECGPYMWRDSVGRDARFRILVRVSGATAPTDGHPRCGINTPGTLRDPSTNPVGDVW